MKINYICPRPPWECECFLLLKLQKTYCYNWKDINCKECYLQRLAPAAKTDRRICIDTKNKL